MPTPTEWAAGSKLVITVSGKVDSSTNAIGQDYLDVNVGRSVSGSGGQWAGNFYPSEVLLSVRLRGSGHAEITIPFEFVAY